MTDKTKNKQQSDQPVKEGDSAPPSGSPGDLESRRQAVRRILAGGGIIAGSQALPGEWTRPVVDSVILPAHAATSLQDPCIVTILSGDQASGSVLVRVDGVVTPPQGGVDVTVNVAAIGGGNDTAGPFNAATESDGTYTVNNITLSGGPGISAVRATVSVPGDSDTCETPVPASSTQPPTSTSTSTLPPSTTPTSTLPPSTTPTA